jgi:hypothetical protein
LAGAGNVAVAFCQSTAVIGRGAAAEGPAAAGAFGGLAPLCRRPTTVVTATARTNGHEAAK